ncbi:hypothetical protein EGR52_00580 [bacterium]|mgnify:FL=1|jgi:hypothetical protein|nr:hypothetical protein [bacterium]MBS5805999.1 hypothetical protein [Bacillota bacterium]CDE49125.1 unknown [Firmicutes bacterium CAG:460]
MNVIVSNKYQSLLASLNIDVIKSINGEFSVDDLIAQFSTFYYNKMILDITAIKGYEDINIMQNLSVNFDMSKVILLLDDSEVVNSPVYISQLISMGIYNFTNDVNTIKYLIDNPNQYKDVANYHNISGFKKPVLNEKAIDNTRGKIGQKIIGFKNVTEHAGATTLIYLLKLHLEKSYKVKAVEIDKNDFVYFNDESLESISSLGFNDFLSQNSDYDVILVDLNEGNVLEYCHDIVYLIEPGLIKLNKLIRQDNAIFEKLSDKKIVLNRSVLSEKDVMDFEKESGSKVFFNMPCLDDKLDDQKIINIFLTNLGFSRVEENSSNGIFSIFK